MQFLRKIQGRKSNFETTNFAFIKRESIFLFERKGAAKIIYRKILEIRKNKQKFTQKIEKFI